VIGRIVNRDHGSEARCGCFEYILIFKNRGASAAGASLSHPHSTHLATPRSCPNHVPNGANGAKNYFESPPPKERWCYADMISRNTCRPARGSSRKTDFVAFVAFAGALAL